MAVVADNSGSGRDDVLVFDAVEIRELCLRSMNMGMRLRQEQLSGRTTGKSGKVILDEWLDVVMNRKRAGLNP